MKLRELLKYVNPISIVGTVEADITGVNIDSRKIEEGHLFVAIKGTQTDGHRFIPKALERSCSHSFLWRALTPLETGWSDGHQR